jgi:hypothetical protein
MSFRLVISVYVGWFLRQVKWTVLQVSYVRIIVFETYTGCI